MLYTSEEVSSLVGKFLVMQSYILLKSQRQMWCSFETGTTIQGTNFFPV